MNKTQLNVTANSFQLKKDKQHEPYWQIGQCNSSNQTFCFLSDFTAAQENWTSNFVRPSIVVK
jgi:hypothetical protein